MKSRIKFGFLGGGQLARMMAQSAHRYGMEPWVYSAHKNDPAQQVTQFSTLGEMNDSKSIKRFLDSVDVATFESEFMDADLLTQVDTDKKIWPRPQVMAQLQDRLPQKKLLDKSKMATAPWVPVANEAETIEAANTLGLPLVFKKRRFGYDGYGTFVIKTKNALNKFIHTEIKSQDIDFIAEKWIPFKRELACMFARSRKGEVVHYPLVESFQKDSRCFWVKGPIKDKRFNKWAKQFEKLLTKIKYVGVIGVELFDCPQGLLVNELAPRVHNSGHYTQNAFSVSQFDLHIKAITGQSLTLPKCNANGFAMVNLLGGKKAPTPSWQLPPSSHLHWYGKIENRPGRKMGHINSVGTSPAAALKIALADLKKFKL